MLFPSVSHLDGMPLIGSPWPTMAILAAYWISIRYIGPAIMKNREPIDVKKWILYYNIYQIVANVILFGWTIQETFRPDNNLYCLQTSRNSAMLCYLYYLNKLTDLTETYFFLLKKSWRQVSHLHLYHHIAMITCCYVDIYMQPGKCSPSSVAAMWIITGHDGSLMTACTMFSHPPHLTICCLSHIDILYTLSIPGGLSMYMLLFNTFVHVIMYTYYLLSSLKLNITFLPAIKKSVTQIQLVNQ